MIFLTGEDCVLKVTVMVKEKISMLLTDSRDARVYSQESKRKNGRHTTSESFKK